MELLPGLRIIAADTGTEEHARRARIAGDECRRGGRCLRHRFELSPQDRRDSRYFATDERLLEIIVQMFQRDEFNKIRLANKAIAQYEAETYIGLRYRRTSWKPPSTASCTPMTCR